MNNKMGIAHSNYVNENVDEKHEREEKLQTRSDDATDAIDDVGKCDEFIPSGNGIKRRRKLNNYN